MFQKFYLGLPRNDDLTKSDKAKGLSQEPTWFSGVASAMSSAKSQNQQSNGTKMRGGEVMTFSKPITVFLDNFYHGWIWGGTGSSYQNLNFNCLCCSPLAQSTHMPYFILNLNSRILSSPPSRSKPPVTCMALLRETVWPQLWFLNQKGAAPTDQHHLVKLFKSPIPWPLSRHTGGNH